MSGHKVKKIWTLTYISQRAGKMTYTDRSVQDLLDHVRMMGIEKFHLSCSCGPKREQVH